MDEDEDMDVVEYNECKKIDEGINEYYLFYWRFLALQNSFNKELCDSIYGEDTEHIYRLWTESNSNVITFITLLNEINKKKLFKWIYTIHEN